MSQKYLFIDESDKTTAVWTMKQASIRGTPTGDNGADYTYIGPVIFEHGAQIVAADECVPGRLYFVDTLSGRTVVQQIGTVLKKS